MVLTKYITETAKAAKEAYFSLTTVSAAQKNLALSFIAKDLAAQQEVILAANEIDMKLARQQGLDAALLDRLQLTERSIEAMVDGVHQVVALADPVGEMDEFRTLPSGITLGKMRVPLGVIGMIYESRPNVTLDAAILCLKSGNSCILRGGSEAINSNRAIAAVITGSLKKAGLPEAAVNLLTETDRAGVDVLVNLPEYIDVIIPRGGKGLVQRVNEKARVPVIKHLDGICHVYIDVSAATEMAIDIAVNAKTSRYGTCNTMETLLIHASRAAELLPLLQQRYAEKNVELRGCVQTQRILADKVIPAIEADWSTEYLAPILSIKVVADVNEAINHINHYGSHHTDTIVTNDLSHAQLFLRAVDSASVMVNASTRFADGYEYGLGAEIGISTDKIHVRGPVGLHGLTSQKWIVLGHGQVRL
ncbi:glutamate-5-semialdehyde dehydrogenase [Snodgrassella alvi]|jgi:glutamate-5-semialdehyde dehydrogenase|uniref:Gamma-glutamyl phosphate reductase n=1 Tax=Snodgrassella alvi TaxID=1196083 RepID=A0A2N9XZK4_9NEIS|nr:glutamate-5-semialdehyde dehydrogenase [Snodgrassella alvi]PIT56946.1 glutamate-5-semialdehyde dehydrogenase [Snodgrassella alvi]PIT57401.1 glutamate-5-semialdehyde dehydrogenase [Snodgrassella alvi]